jgi:hypothetical protein
MALIFKALHSIIITRARKSIGANKKRNLLLLPEEISFENNFKPSAKGCNKPKTPTTEGPRLFELQPLFFF